MNEWVAIWSLAVLVGVLTVGPVIASVLFVRAAFKYESSLLGGSIKAYYARRENENTTPCGVREPMP